MAGVLGAPPLQLRRECVRQPRALRPRAVRSRARRASCSSLRLHPTRGGPTDRPPVPRSRLFDLPDAHLPDSAGPGLRMGAPGPRPRLPLEHDPSRTLRRTSRAPAGSNLALRRLTTVPSTRRVSTGPLEEAETVEA